CVEPGTNWRFVGYVRPGAPASSKLVEATSAWLKQALTQIGIGAKTSAGYGRLRPLNKSDAEAQAKAAKVAAVTEAAANEQVKLAADKAKAHAAAQLALKSDYPNESTYKNALLRPAENPGQWPALQKEIEKLRKPENADWRARFKRDTSDRAYRKL